VAHGCDKIEGWLGIEGKVGWEVRGEGALGGVRCVVQNEPVVEERVGRTGDVVALGVEDEPGRANQRPG